MIYLQAAALSVVASPALAFLSAGWSQAPVWEPESQA
jgi:hypothetical protein